MGVQSLSSNVNKFVLLEDEILIENRGTSQLYVIKSPIEPESLMLQLMALLDQLCDLQTKIFGSFGVKGNQQLIW